MNTITNPTRNRGFRRDEQGRVLWTGVYAGLTRTYVVIDAKGKPTATKGFRAQLATTYYSSL